MLSLEQTRKLEGQCFCKDKKKTKERINADYFAITSAQKQAVVYHSGLSHSYFYKVRKNGIPSIRMILAMATELNVTPYYYTGETDDKFECSETLVKQFLVDNGYADITAEMETPSGPKDDVVETAAITDTINMDEEDAMFLLKVLFMRAKISKSARAKLNAAICVMAE